MTHMRVLPKPAKGSAAKARRAARAAIERRERAAKLAAIKRDYFRCRRCRCNQVNCPDTWGKWLEAAHLIDKGMGGDHGRYSCEPKHFVTLCTDCHRGPRSVHSGHIVMTYGPDMGDGVVHFVRRRDDHEHCHEVVSR